MKRIIRTLSTFILVVVMIVSVLASDRFALICFATSQTEETDQVEVKVSGGYCTSDEYDIEEDSYDFGDTSTTWYEIESEENEISVHKGDKVYIVAKDGYPGHIDKKIFTKWEVVSGNVTLEDPKSYFTSFIAGDENASIKAVYTSIPKEGKRFKYKGNTYEVVYGVCKAAPGTCDWDGNFFDGCVEVGLVKINSKTKNLVVPDYFEYQNLTYRVSQIEYCKLAGNSKLKSVSLPTTLSCFGDETFKGCTNLKKIVLSGKDKVDDVDLFCMYSVNAFNNISKKAVIYVPKGQLKAFKKYFRHKYYAGTVIDSTTKIKGK